MPRVPKVPSSSPSGKKTAPAGYKNYGQYRSERVQARNTARKTETTSYSRPKTKTRFGAKEMVDSGTRGRTISRYNRLKAKGISIPGLSQADLDTGAGARKVKRALARSRKFSINRPRSGA